MLLYRLLATIDWRLGMGGARRENLQGLLGPSPPALEHEYGVRVGGLISHGYLCPYAVTFDLERMVLRLEPADPRPTRR